MTELTLRLFFHGLIAFVPSSPDGAGAMTAYTVNHCQHNPTLAFEITGGIKCPKDQRQGRAVCSASGSWCACDLGGFEMSFKQIPLGPGRPINDRVGSPAGESDAADPAWLVRLHNVNDARVRIDPAKVSGATSSRIAFNWISVRSCHLDQVDNNRCTLASSEGRSFGICPLTFVSNDGAGSHEQAVSEYLMFQLKFHSVSGFVTLVLADQAGSINIDLECSGQNCPDLLVGNMASTRKEKDEDDNEGRHFLAYYNLAPDGVTGYYPVRRERPPLSVGNRQLHNCSGDPFRRRLGLINLRLQDAAERKNFLELCSQEGKKSDFNEVDCAIYNAAQSRIICPTAMFDP